MCKMSHWSYSSGVAILFLENEMRRVKITRYYDKSELK